MRGWGAEIVASARDWQGANPGDLMRLPAGPVSRYVCRRTDFDREDRSMTRADAIDRARQHFRSGEFLKILDRRVGYRTESQKPDSGDALRAYLVEDLIPAFAQLDFATRLVESPTGKGPYLLADYHEDASLPTVLTYGHGDVVDGMAGEWRDNLDPWRTTTKGERVYGRGTADNKGQHSINMSALRSGARGARRQARLQRQIHHRDRRRDRLARSAPGVRGTARGIEGRSVFGVRRAAAVGGSSDHFPRLPRRLAYSSRRQSARRRASFRQLGRRARQCRDHLFRRDRVAGRREGPHAARRAETAAHLEPDPRRARRREGRTISGRACAVAGLGRGGALGRRAALCLEHA